jgi:hypothetical protein
MAQSGLRHHDLTLRPHSAWDSRPLVPERFIPVDRRVTASQTQQLYEPRRWRARSLRGLNELILAPSVASRSPPLNGTPLVVAVEWPSLSAARPVGSRRPADRSKPQSDDQTAYAGIEEAFKYLGELAP